MPIIPNLTTFQYESRKNQKKPVDSLQLRSVRTMAESGRDAAAKKSEALYNDMRAAIQETNYRQMRRIIADPDYEPNRVGAGDKRTALHTAAHEDDQGALDILLKQTSIDTNVRTAKGLTPFLYAASRGRMVSFEVLMNDSRVNVKARDGEDQTAMELITSLGKEIKANKAKELLANRIQKPVAGKGTIKLALLIGNSDYQGSGWGDLPGAKKDLTDMEARMKANSYQVEVIENSPDTLQAVQDVMNNTPVSSVTHMQVLYVGG